MKKVNFLILLAVISFSSCKQQNSEDYDALIAEARELYNSGNYEDSGEKYSEAFEAESDNDSLVHHYEAARTWALAGNKDAAFEQLLEISENEEYADLGQLSTEDDFNSLRTEERWMTVLKQVSENKKKAGARLAEVTSVLETVYHDDQKYRQEADAIKKKYGHNSEEVRQHWKLINKQDSINLIKVENIIEEHGWLSTEEVGRNANSALFLVIQHADMETQVKYLPVLRKAVKEGDARPDDLALLEDRVALKQGKRQIYGSQIGIDQETGEYYVSPLQDPDNVNKRRAEVGLAPIEDYISNWDLTWDAEAYKKQLPQLEEKN